MLYKYNFFIFFWGIKFFENYKRKHLFNILDFQKLFISNPIPLKGNRYQGVRKTLSLGAQAQLGVLSKEKEFCNN
jgi:hypothetical protein